MPPTEPAASTKTRWGRTVEQIRQNWNELFQAEIKTFKDEWIVHYQEELPVREEWDEPLIEPIKITYKCKECAYIWKNYDGKVHLFSRLAMTKETSNKKGEILICLENQHCPKCCNSTTIPEMDVQFSEMSAVMRHLKDEIGLYYKIHYIRNVGKTLKVNKGKAAAPSCYHGHSVQTSLKSITKEERKIKNSHKSTKKTKPIAAISVSNSPADEPLIKVQQKPKKGRQFNNPAESSPASEASPGSSSIPSVSKDRDASFGQAKQKKKNNSGRNRNDRDETLKNSNQFTFYNHSYYNHSHEESVYKPQKRESKPVIAHQPINVVSRRNPNNKPVSKPKKTSRWNKTPEEVREEWEPIFDNIFQKFITSRDPDDKWTFALGEFIREEQRNKDIFPKNRKQLIFSDYSSLIRYRCSRCSNTWVSHLPFVSFRIRQFCHLETNWKLQGGHITIDIKTGQKCKQCPAQYEKYYENGAFDHGEIERILTEVLNKIEVKFYGKVGEKNLQYSEILIKINHTKASIAKIVRMEYAAFPENL